ncbi:MAG: hypothetical protein NVSMB57_09800 [Actinomycetota bacterium]
MTSVTELPVGSSESQRVVSALPFFGDLRDRVALSPLAMLVLSLPDQRIRLANDPAADLFRMERTTLVGRRLSQLLSVAETAKVNVALSALSTGALDSYRVRRQLRVDGDPVEVSMWVRILRVPHGALAVVILVPDADTHVVGRSVGTFFGPDALDLAVGTMDETGRIEQITPNSRVMLGRDQADLAGRTFIELAHQDDADRLAKALLGSTDTVEDIALSVRMRHLARGWIDVCCLFFPLAGHDPPRTGFVLSQPSGANRTGPDDARLEQLERHLLRIAAEVHGAGLPFPSAGETEGSRCPSLKGLPARQLDIVERLLRGERIATIASSMYLSPSTVRNHLSHVFARFKVHSQSELLVFLRSDLSITPP